MCKADAIKQGHYSQKMIIFKNINYLHEQVLFLLFRHFWDMFHRAVTQTRINLLQKYS